MERSKRITDLEGERLRVELDTSARKQLELNDLGMESREARAEFLSNVHQVPEWWLSRTEVTLIQAVEHLATWRRWFDWSGHLCHRATVKKQRALRDLEALDSGLDARLDEIGQELEARSVEETNDEARMRDLSQTANTTGE